MINTGYWGDKFVEPNVPYAEKDIFWFYWNYSGREGKFNSRFYFHCGWPVSFCYLMEGRVVWMTTFFKMILDALRSVILIII